MQNLFDGKNSINSEFTSNEACIYAVQHLHKCMAVTAALLGVHTQAAVPLFLALPLRNAELGAKSLGCLSKNQTFIFSYILSRGSVFKKASTVPQE